jgi:UDP-N-acetylmuramoylalanine--D-glutamate ligase
VELKGKTVAIVGLARSGVAAAKLCASRGATVIASDAGSSSALASVLGELKAVLAEVETGGNSAAFLQKADLIVVSPGVPLAIEPIQSAKAAGVKILGEIELAASFLDRPIAAITGSNGKTTTTVLCGLMLQRSGIKTFVGGNIGVALSDLALDLSLGDVAVVELSSFQLEEMEQFQPDAAAILNITEDHLDRYPSFDAYAETKMNLLSMLPASGLAVVNANDEQIRSRAKAIAAPTLYFGDASFSGAHLDGEILAVEDEQGSARYDLKNFTPLGMHNRENAMAAVLLARKLGATDEGIAKAFSEFKAPPHRLEFVREVRGIKIFNDSKATSPASVETALAAFSEPLVVLLGGRSKGADFSKVGPVLARAAKTVICFGEAGPHIAEQVKLPVAPIVVGDVDAALASGLEFCAPGDVLLFAPGCASFDQFRNYEHRGEHFKERVNDL